MPTNTAGVSFYHGPSMHRTPFDKLPLVSLPFSVNSASNHPHFPGQGNQRRFQLWTTGLRRARQCGMSPMSTSAGQFGTRKTRPIPKDQHHPNSILDRRSGSQPGISISPVKSYVQDLLVHLPLSNRLI